MRKSHTDAKDQDECNHDGATMKYLDTGRVTCFVCGKTLKKNNDTNKDTEVTTQ